MNELPYLVVLKTNDTISGVLSKNMDKKRRIFCKTAKKSVHFQKIIV